MEVHVRRNSADAADGLFELWLDGRPAARRDALDWDGRASAHAWNAVFLENYWNAGSPADQSRTFDNFVVSTARIGCL